MPPPSYQRARRPEQKAERCQHILATARELLSERADVLEVGFNELARHAGMAKSNLYRYFESREAVLLSLLQEEWRGWERDAVASLRTLGKSPRRDRRVVVAEALAAVTAQRPLMCRLNSVLPTVLEANISPATAAEVKRAAATLLERIAEAMESALPETDRQAHVEVLRHAFTYMVAAWPLAHPAPAVTEALALPELQWLRHDFRQDLTRLLTLLLRGLSK